MKKTQMGDNMKLIKTLLSVIAGGLLSSQAMAHVHKMDSNLRPSISLGYEQAKLPGFGDLKGANAKFQFETAFPVGFMVSTTAMRDEWVKPKPKYKKSKKDTSKSHKSQIEYYSLMAGPTVRLSHILSVYALAGVSHTHLDVKNVPASAKNRPNRFAYSAGITADVTSNLVFNAGYEGSKISIAGKDHNLNALVAGVGYRF
ncbi:Ail/Lom family outer membrane beta-barrel protein [Pantoea sp. C8B4]|uniref:Ail/Lom family outer membrane beta-barrel protein n=1 Tax=Pantoea sp. C8B4 TaxID=3243083 RepID=UPI003EDB1C89